MRFETLDARGSTRGAPDMSTPVVHHRRTCRHRPRHRAGFRREGARVVVSGRRDEQAKPRRRTARSRRASRIRARRRALRGRSAQLDRTDRRAFRPAGRGGRQRRHRRVRPAPLSTRARTTTPPSSRPTCWARCYRSSTDVGVDDGSGSVVDLFFGRRAGGFRVRGIVRKSSRPKL